MEHEKEKYTKLWALGRYGEGKHGELAVPKFLELCDDDVIIEFGCGPGRAGLLMKNAGREVHMTDIACNTLDRFVRQELDDKLTFTQGAAHEVKLPAMGSIFSADMLEHIPTDMVRRTLDNMFYNCDAQAFFNIALRMDTSGARYGVGPLHLTVKHSDWWVDQLSEYGEIGYLKIKEGDELTIEVVT